MIEHNSGGGRERDTFCWHNAYFVAVTAIVKVIRFFYNEKCKKDPTLSSVNSIWKAFFSRLLTFSNGFNAILFMIVPLQMTPFDALSSMEEKKSILARKKYVLPKKGKTQVQNKNTSRASFEPLKNDRPLFISA